MNKAYQTFIRWRVFNGAVDWGYGTYRDGYTISVEDAPGIWFIKFDGDTAKYIKVDQTRPMDYTYEAVEGEDAYWVDWREELRNLGEEFIKLSNMK